MARSHFIEILMILTKYVFDIGVQLTEFSVIVESVTLRFYCIDRILPQENYFRVDTDEQLQRYWYLS